MSFLDEIKDRLPFGRNIAPEPYGDEVYDDYYTAGDDAAYDDYTNDYGQPAQDGYRAYEPFEAGNGTLGQTRRGEAESIAVYTRSGQPINEPERHATTYNARTREAAGEATARSARYDSQPSYDRGRHYRSAAPQDTAAPLYDGGARQSVALDSSAQLPAYILRPESYDDIETVVRRVRTRQPVVLVFVDVRTEIAKRVLDFSYGFACGSGATVQEIGERIYIVLPQGCEVKDSDLSKLRTQGYLNN